MEKTLGRLKALTAHTDDAAVGQGVVLDEHGGVLGEPLVELEVVGDVAQLLLDLADGFEIGCAVEGVAAAEEQLDQIAGDVAASYVEAFCEVVEDDGFVDGDDVGDAVARVDDYTGAEACVL